MTSRDFCYWLQGYFEVAKPKKLTDEQLQMIKNHLSMVFYHEIDPSNGNEEHNKKLHKLHEGTSTDTISEEMIKNIIDGKTSGSGMINC